MILIRPKMFTIGSDRVIHDSTIIAMISKYTEVVVFSARLRHRSGKTHYYYNNIKVKSYCDHAGLFESINKMFCTGIIDVDVCMQIMELRELISAQLTRLRNHIYEYEPSNVIYKYDTYTKCSNSMISVAYGLQHISDEFVALLSSLTQQQVASSILWQMEKIINSNICMKAATKASSHKRIAFD